MQLAGDVVSERSIARQPRHGLNVDSSPENLDDHLGPQTRPQFNDSANSLLVLRGMNENLLESPFNRVALRGFWLGRSDPSWKSFSSE